MEVVQAGNYDSDEWHQSFSRGLGVGSAEGFDEAAAPLQLKYVRIKGRVNDTCSGWFGRMCTDRVPDIEPMSIAAAQPPKES
jgi:hypothetical protein